MEGVRAALEVALRQACFLGHCHQVSRTLCLLNKHTQTTLRRSRNRKHATSLQRLPCAGLNTSPASSELLAGRAVLDLSLSPQCRPAVGTLGRVDE